MISLKEKFSNVSSDNLVGKFHTCSQADARGTKHASYVHLHADPVVPVHTHTHTQTCVFLFHSSSWYPFTVNHSHDSTC